MATKDSQELKSDERYPFGEYSFRIERTSVPGSTNDKIEAICTDKDGKNARKSIQLPSSTQLDGWYVEANETEATVYAIVKVSVGGDSYTSDLDTSPARQPIPVGPFNFTSINIFQYQKEVIISCDHSMTNYVYSSYGVGHIIAGTSNESCTITRIALPNDKSTTQYALNRSYTHNNLTVYYTISGLQNDSDFTSVSGAIINNGEIVSFDESTKAKIAWTMIYGNASGGEYETKQVIVGRFAIDLEDAGGVGPGSDWTDPGDYDPDWEEGDPTHTLYVTVIGALSGRHNDPIEDPSYSYIPADKDTVKDYGCGGDGGHGGGGGAGASTVVIHKFATNQANSKEVTAIARRHGYGSGGGKGGKGGDGCILVYY